jgi:hypothetical protein
MITKEDAIVISVVSIINKYIKRGNFKMPVLEGVKVCHRDTKDLEVPEISQDDSEDDYEDDRVSAKEKTPEKVNKKVRTFPVKTVKRVGLVLS